MPDPGHFLRATHSKSKECVSLELKDNQTWHVGRGDGTVRADQWTISFDPALSRDHFRVKFGAGKLLVEAAKNRHPILFKGEPQANFSLASGQSFSTAHTLFELEERSSTFSKEPIFWIADLQQELDLLGFTGMLSVLFNGGATFGRIFKVLNCLRCTWMRPLLSDVETAVTRDREPLSKALARHPQVFSPPYLAQVEVGESSDLGKSLNRLFRRIARDHRERRPIPCPFPAEVSAAFQNIADILDSGGSQANALALAGRASVNESVLKGLVDLHAQMRAGSSLPECNYPPVFPAIAHSLISAHEAVGTLATAFREVADLLAPVAPNEAKS